MATFDYLDMQMIRRARERGREGGEKMERDASPSVFLFGASQRESRVCVWERVFAALLASRTDETPPASPEKTPPRYASRRVLIVGHCQEFACRRTFRRGNE